MTEDLRKSIASLRAISPKLNTATDQAMAVVQAVEAFLADECGIGIEARVHVEEVDEQPEDPRDDRGHHTDTYLAYARVNGKFRVAVEYRHTITRGDRDDLQNFETLSDVRESIQAWAESPRAAKLATFPSLPELLHSIEVEAEKMVAQANTAGETVKLMMDAVKPDKVASVQVTKDARPDKVLEVQTGSPSTVVRIAVGSLGVESTVRGTKASDLMDKAAKTAQEYAPKPPRR